MPLVLPWMEPANVFIADTDNNRVLKVAPDGTQTVVTT